MARSLALRKEGIGREYEGEGRRGRDGGGTYFR